MSLPASIDEIEERIAELCLLATVDDGLGGQVPLVVHAQTDPTCKVLPGNVPFVVVGSEDAEREEYSRNQLIVTRIYIIEFFYKQVSNPSSDLERWTLRRQTQAVLDVLPDFFWKRRDLHKDGRPDALAYNSEPMTDANAIPMAFQTLNYAGTVYRLPVSVLRFQE